MLKYEILEHRADLKIRAFGKDKKELFSNMLLGMAESQRPEFIGEEKTKRNIGINSSDSSALLVDFLNEILYQNQTKKEVYNAAKFLKFNDKEIESEIFGQKVKRFGEDIKAATFHDLDIHQNPDGNWQATVLFDI